MRSPWAVIAYGRIDHMGLVRKIAEVRQKYESCHGTIPLSRRIRSGLSSSGHIKGFTIVELLIVIVVIAILAAISVVAYTGIQNSAHDAAVKSDLANLAKQIQIYHAHTGVYPSALDNEQMSLVNMSATKSSYSDNFYLNGTAYNLLVCTSNNSSSSGFVVAAESKSGNVFINSSRDGAVDAGHPLVSRATLCPQYGVSPYTDSRWMYVGGSWISLVR